jgi:hypothetical protein
MKWDRLDANLFPKPPPAAFPSHHLHHALSRRAFMGSVLGVTGAAFSAGLLPTAVLAKTKTANAAPRPTPNSDLPPFRFTFFGPTADPSSIGDFDGLVGVADVRGTGKATNPDGTTETLVFDTDMRFMSGHYIGVDGHVHKGTFGFV